MVNTGPLSNNLLVNKAILNILTSVQDNQTSKSSELFGQLLEQALLQAKMTSSNQDSSSTLLGSLNPANFTALGLSSALSGTSSSLVGMPSVMETNSSSMGNSLIDSVQSLIEGSTLSKGSLQNQEVDVSTLNGQLEGTLRNAGHLFVEAGKKHQINPAFLAAVSMHETGNGSSNASRFKNNVAGMMGRNGLKSYDSIEESIFEMARNLRNNYLDEGKLTISQIGAKYAPVGAANDPTGLNNHWVKGVQGYFDKMVKTDFSL
jgi:hypothetical protein